MLLAELAEISRAVGATPSRLAKVEALASALRRMQPDEVAVGVSYLVGELRQGRVGLGFASVRDAMARASPAERATLTLAQVDSYFARLAALSGAGSASAKRDAIASLLSLATRPEQDFLVRLVMGELRQGALEGVLVEALARAAQAPAAVVRRAVMIAGDLRAVAGAALADGPAGLERFHLRIFSPIQPMLASPADDVDDALASLGEAALEHKLDGARVQAHKDGSDVRVFSRALRDVTHAVPEVVEAVRALPARRAILDGEALALRTDGAPHPFQVTMRRLGRKLDVASLRQEIPLSAFFFDALHLDGEDLLARPAAERFGALAAAAPARLVVPRLVTGDPERAAAFLDEALRRGHEGIMAKSLTAPYEAGSRGSSWRKVKLAQTLDLVVLAAEWGHGRRSGWLSNLHLGARDPAGGGFAMVGKSSPWSEWRSGGVSVLLANQDETSPVAPATVAAAHAGFAMVGKTFKGLSDAMLAWQTERLRALAVAEDDFTVFVRPELVVEVAFGDVQTSPRYPAGLALRFARVKRYREDKRADEADTVDALRALHRHGPR
jgi:ATP-dependent DNA ligase I